MLPKDQIPIITPSLNRLLPPAVNRWLFLLFWLYAAFLVIMNLTPGNTQPMEMKKIMFIRSDYFYHTIAYIILAGLFFTASLSSRPVFRQNPVLWGILVFIFLASVPEFLQHFVPRRRFNWWDMTANFTGLGLGSLIAILYFKIFIKNNRTSGPPKLNS